MSSNPKTITNKKENKKPTYTRRPGTVNRGGDYEVNMLALYALRLCLREDVEDILIASNPEGFEALDDIVIRVEFYTKNPELYILQLKHKMKKNITISGKDFTKKDFSLQIYKHSYKSITRDFNNKVDDLMKGISLSDVTVCLVSNAKMKVSGTFIIDPSTKLSGKLLENETKDFINTKCESDQYYSFQVIKISTEENETSEEREFSEFFSKFRFYDEQANYERAESKITDLLNASFGTNCPEIMKQYLDFIRTYITKTGEINFLCKIDIKMKLLELLTGIVDKAQLERKYQVFENITNIYDSVQRNIVLKQINVCLQGRDPVCLCDLAKKSFCDSISTEFVLKNIDETIRIGFSDCKKPDVYIRRRFHKILLKKSVLRKTKENIFIFSNSITDEIRSCLCVLDINDLAKSDFTDGNIAIVVDPDKIDSSVKKIENLSHLKSFSLHHLREYSSSCLEWRQSWRDVEKLNSFIANAELINESVNEQSALQYFQQSLNVVNAAPGMGKTTVLKALTEYCKPDELILTLDLNLQENYLQDATSELRRHPLNYICNLMKSKRDDDFETKIFQYLKEESKLILFVDGFDEISPKYSGAVLSIIQEFKSLQVTTWLFTRPTAVFFLTKRFCILPINLVQLTVQQIMNYLAVKYDATDSEVVECLTKVPLDFYKTPQYLHMISCTCKSLADIRDIKVVDLYEMYIDMCFDKETEKLQINKESNAIDFILPAAKKMYMKVQETAALLDVFGKAYLLENNVFNEKVINKRVDYFNNRKNNFQLLRQFSDTMARFSHKTYAEYFAALGIYKYLLKKKFVMLYERLLDDELFESILLTFDRISAKNYSLHSAVVEKDLEKVKIFCNGSPDSQELDEFGRTPLHYALNKQFTSTDFVPIKILDFLLYHFRNNEDILQRRDNLSNMKFCELATKETKEDLPCRAAACGAMNVLKSILPMNRDYLEKKDKYTNLSPLQISVSSSQVECTEYLIEMGYDINIKNSFGETLLHIATKINNLNMVKILIKKGANINEPDLTGKTPLHTALFDEHSFLAEKLLNRLANLNLIEKRGDESAIYYDAKIDHTVLLELKDKHDEGISWKYTPFFPAPPKCNEDVSKYLINAGTDINLKTGKNQSAFHFAAKGGTLNILKLLKEKGVYIDEADSHGCTSLHFAALTGHDAAVEYLIDAGADVSLRTNENQSAIHFAAQSGIVDVLNLLKKQGVNIDEADSNGHTPLHIAAVNGHSAVVKYLIDAGADVSLRTNDNRSVIHLAAESVSVDVLNLLKKQGVNINEADSEGCTPLHIAAFKGHSAAVKYLIDAGADVSLRTNENQSAIHFAAHSGSVDVLNLLKKQGVNIDEADSKGCTPLHFAAFKGHCAAVLYLIDAGADVSLRTNDNRSVIHLAAESGSVDVLNLLKKQGVNIDEADSEGCTPLHFAAIKGHCAAVLYLIDAGADVSLRTNDNRSVIHLAAESGSVDVLNLLKKQGVNIDEADSNGCTPLHFAAIKGHCAAVLYLIDAGADVSLRTNDNRSVINLAAHSGSVDVLNLLKKQGVNIDEADSNGHTPLQLAAFNGHSAAVKYLIDAGADVSLRTNENRSVIHFAAHSGSVDVLNLLKKQGVNIDEADSKGCTPLHFAAFKGHCATVLYLIDAGADVSLRTNENRSVIHLAAESGSVDVLYLLKKQGVNINEADSKGCTPLHFAAIKGHSAAVLYLIDAGADVSLRTNDNRSVIHLAAESGSVDVLNLLKKQGVNIDEADSNGWTPLHVAALKGHSAAVKYLVDVGADVRLRTRRNTSVMHFAANGGNLDVLKLLKEQNVNINEADSNGCTPLFVAIMNGHDDIITYIMDALADVSF